MNKPFKSYNGGKEASGTYQKIISTMAPHDIYIDAFVGNGAIFRHKKAAAIHSILIDIDPAVTEKWAILQGTAAIVENEDAISFLNHFKPAADIFKKMGIEVLIYLDPPYPKECRKSQQDLYKYEMNTMDHNALLFVARSINAKVVISSYPNELYNALLKDWNSFTFQSQTRSGTATEKVWYNYPQPKELHDYRYIGNSFRERERIKGIIYRNASKINKMQDLERNAFIEHLKINQII